MPRSLNKVHSTIVELANKPGGMHNSDLCKALGITDHKAGAALNGSRDAGRIVSVEHPRKSGGRRHLRWFGSLAAARAWQAGPPPQREPGLNQYTAGASKIAPIIDSKEAISAFDARNIKHGPAPVFGVAARYYVDPESIPRFRYGSGG